MNLMDTFRASRGHLEPRFKANSPSKCPWVLLAMDTRTDTYNLGSTYVSTTTVHEIKEKRVKDMKSLSIGFSGFHGRSWTLPELSAFEAGFSCPWPVRVSMDTHGHSLGLPA
jgi:hypothetical protein